MLFSADKVSKKAENIADRRNANRERALQQMEKLKDQLLLHQFLQVYASQMNNMAFRDIAQNECYFILLCL